MFIIFFKKGAVNITGIKRFDDLSNAVENFCATFGINLQNISNYIIDNVCAHGNFGRALDLEDLKQRINRKEHVSSRIETATLNISYFPAAFCKTFCIGTVLVFYSGKYNIVGAKCQQQVDEIFQEILVYISKL